MRDARDFTEVVKKVALAAVAASKPVAVQYGVVVSAEPLQIRIDQKLTLGAAQLALCHAVTDYTVDIENGGVGQICRVLGHLKEGEQVAMLRMQGGQKYLVLDRVAP